jgi:FKBP-type peptidyl-prolyl cis-trans isomerase
MVVNYSGKLTNGTEFDSSYHNHRTNPPAPFTFQLGAHHVIRGWDEGIVGMHVGGKRHLVIPPSLAYGARAVGDKIPANSTLVFDVELVNVLPAHHP